MAGLIFGLLECAVAFAGVPEPAALYPPGLQVLDLTGHAVDPFADVQSKATLFIFVSVDCPVSNSYMPEYGRLQTEFSAKGVAMRLVYPDSDDSPERIRKHLKEYGCNLEALRDPRHELVKASLVRVTPEVAVFLPKRGLMYHGRIDDRYVELGKARPAALTHDLKDTLNEILQGKLRRPRSTRAVGCYIPNVR